MTLPCAASLATLTHAVRIQRGIDIRFLEGNPIVSGFLFLVSGCDGTVKAIRFWFLVPGFEDVGA
jgi:hypothetical protein